MMNQLDSLTLREATEVLTRYLSAYYENRDLLAILTAFRNKNSQRRLSSIVNLQLISAKLIELLESLYTRHCNTNEIDIPQCLTALENEIKNDYRKSLRVGDMNDNLDIDLQAFCDLTLVNRNRYQDQMQLVREVRQNGNSALLLLFSDLYEIVLSPAQKKLFESNRTYETFHSFIALRSVLNPAQLTAVGEYWRVITEACHAKDYDNAAEISAFRKLYQTLDSDQRREFNVLPVLDDYGLIFDFEKAAGLSTEQIKSVNRICYYHEINALRVNPDDCSDRLLYDLFFSPELALSDIQRALFAVSFEGDFTKWLEFIQLENDDDLLTLLMPDVQKYTNGKYSKVQLLENLIDELDLSRAQQNWLTQQFRDVLPARRSPSNVVSHSSIVSGASVSGRKRVLTKRLGDAELLLSTRKRGKKQDDVINQALLEQDNGVHSTSDHRQQLRQPNIPDHGVHSTSDFRQQPGAAHSSNVTPSPMSSQLPQSPTSPFDEAEGFQSAIAALSATQLSSSMSGAQILAEMAARSRRSNVNVNVNVNDSTVVAQTSSRQSINLNSTGHGFNVVTSNTTSWSTRQSMPITVAEKNIIILSDDESDDDDKPKRKLK